MKAAFMRVNQVLKEVAESLITAIGTIKHHVTQIYQLDLSQQKRKRPDTQPKQSWTSATQHLTGNYLPNWGSFQSTWYLHYSSQTQSSHLRQKKNQPIIQELVKILEEYIEEAKERKCVK